MRLARLAGTSARPTVAVYEVARAFMPARFRSPRRVWIELAAQEGVTRLATLYVRRHRVTKIVTLHAKLRGSECGG